MLQISQRSYYALLSKYIWEQNHVKHIIVQCRVGYFDRFILEQLDRHVTVITVWKCQKLGDIWRRKWQPTPVLLPGKFHGLRGSSEPGRLQSMGLQRVGQDWATSLTFTFSLGLRKSFREETFFIYFFSHPSNRYVAGCRMMTERWVLWLLINVPIFTPKAYLCLGVWRYQCLKIPLTVCLFKPTSLGSGLFSLYYHFCRASFSVILSLWTQAAPNCLYGTGG